MGESFLNLTALGQEKPCPVLAARGSQHAALLIWGTKGLQPLLPASLGRGNDPAARCGRAAKHSNLQPLLSRAL